MTLSDEDFANLPDDFDEALEADTSQPDTDTVEDSEVPETDTEDISQEEETTDEDAETEEGTEEDSTEREEDEEGTESVEEEEGVESSETTETEDKPKPVSTEEKINYKGVYEKVFAPFKANGVEIQVKNPEDAVRLMQMGANYHQKMASLKPSLKTLKLLEKNNLLDESKLNFLIDLNNKNPEAITKLLQDSNLDPMDLDISEPVKYTPTPRTVNDAEFLLDATLEEIKDTPAYTKTLNVLTKVWDDASRSAILAAPQNISVLNQHIADGLYDKVMGTVIYERSLGRLQGISDFDAYRQIGDALYAAGQLTPSVPSNPTTKTLSGTSMPKSSADESLRKKRKQAATPNKSMGTPASKIAFDPLALSDEEFEKVDWNKLLK